jgi:hypothetical protein
MDSALLAVRVARYVRSAQEWKQGHIEGSIFVPVTSLRKGGRPERAGQYILIRAMSS